MSSTTLYRLSGIALLIGGGITALGTLIQTFLTEDVVNPFWIPVAICLFAGTLLLQIGFPAVYLRQMKRAGTLGLLGFIFLFCGLAQFDIGFRFFDLVILPWFGKSADLNPPLNFILYSLSATALLFLGSVLFGIAHFRAGVLSKGPVILLLVGLLVNRAGGHVPHLQDFGGMLFSLSFAWFGLALLSVLRSDVAPEPTPMSADSPARA
jgi:hypothetical protein